MTLILRFCDIR